MERENDQKDDEATAADDAKPLDHCSADGRVLLKLRPDDLPDLLQFFRGKGHNRTLGFARPNSRLDYSVEFEMGLVG